MFQTLYNFLLMRMWMFEIYIVKLITHGNDTQNFFIENFVGIP
jgi:hypothetical protein